jgi:hypothetical protein
VSERVELLPLLPAVMRERDLERGEPLRALIELIEAQARVVQEQVTGFYDDLFVETCADWVVPYIGDLVGSTTLFEAVVGRRADVAHTIGYRRRKGVLPMLEQLARDVTGWDAHVVPGFELLAWTQNDDHVRRSAPAAITLGGFVPPPASERVGTANVRDRDPMDRIGGPFEGTAHTVDVRHPARDEGRYGIHNALVFLWRVEAFPLQRTDAARVAPNDLTRWTFSSIGAPVQLFAARQPVPDTPGIAGEHNVRGPVRALAFSAAPAEWYGEDLSFVVHGIDPSLVICKDLSNWSAPPGGNVAIDVNLGRIMFGAALPTKTRHEVSYRYGFSSRIGGGPYKRERRRDRPAWERPDLGADVDPVADPQGFGALMKVPSQQPTLQAALGAWTPAASMRTVIEIEDSGTYTLPTGGLTIPALPAAQPGRELVIQARNQVRPTLVGDVVVASTQLSRLVLDGFLIAGTIAVQGALAELVIRHCTLVPGVTLTADGDPATPAAASLTAAASTTSRSLIIERSISGPLRVPYDATLSISDSIVDAPERADGKPRVALAAPPTGGAAEGAQAGPATTVESSTLLGLVNVRELTRGSSSIFADGPLVCERRQQGCLRFSSFEPDGSQTPRRFRCQPDLVLDAAAPGADLDLIAAAVRPRFTSERYGTPAYAQLIDGGPTEIASGGEQGSEMGAFHHLYQPQREANLRMRLEEYLPFGLEPGLIHVT